MVFTSQDVLADPPFSRLDLVSCRNLLIYLRPKRRRRSSRCSILRCARAASCSSAASETVGGFDDRFEPISKTQRIYPASRPQPARRGRCFRSRRPRRTRRALAARARPRPRGARQLGDLAQQALLEAYAPASVLINARHECLYYFGPTDRYLRVAAGEPSRDLLRHGARRAAQQAQGGDPAGRPGARARRRRRRAGEPRRQRRSR